MPETWQMQKPKSNFIIPKPDNNRYSPYSFLELLFISRMSRTKLSSFSVGRAFCKDFFKSLIIRIKVEQTFAFSLKLKILMFLAGKK